MWLLLLLLSYVILVDDLTIEFYLLFYKIFGNKYLFHISEFFEK